ASQTIILRLSQCSSTADRVASPAISRVSHFPVKSGKSASSGASCRLTAGLPVVGTERALRRGLIRAGLGESKAARGLLEDCLQDAVIAVSVCCCKCSWQDCWKRRLLEKQITRDQPRWGLSSTARHAAAAGKDLLLASAAGWHPSSRSRLRSA